MTTLAYVQAKLAAAQNCHPNAVQTLIAEALDAIDEIARSQPDEFAKTEMWNPLYGGNQGAAPQAAPAVDEREAFEAWALANRLGERTEQMGFRFHDAGDGYPAWLAWQGRAAWASQGFV